MVVVISHELACLNAGQSIATAGAVLHTQRPRTLAISKFSDTCLVWRFCHQMRAHGGVIYLPAMTFRRE